MKKKGSVSEYSEERDRELVRCFRKRLGEVRVIDLDKIFAEVAAHPASRFYVSEFRAAIVIRHHLRHGVWSVKGAKRLEMFQEIEKRVVGLMESRSDLSLDDALVEVINSEAPEFYLTPRSCRTIIYKLLK
ncbi:MAG: hypothetical protein K2M31_05105 [Muribaculaceae bacterium]|nr:hypothetical protein [Muribaculaceae bacterium]